MSTKKNETPETPTEQVSTEPQVETAPTAKELSPEEQLAWNRCVELQAIIDERDAQIVALKEQLDAIQTAPTLEPAAQPHPLDPTPDTLKLAAKLLEEAIFHSGNLSTNEANSLRPMVDALREAAETSYRYAVVALEPEDAPGEIPVSHFGESVVVEPDTDEDNNTDEAEA